MVLPYLTFPITLKTVFLIYCFVMMVSRGILYKPDPDPGPGPLEKTDPGPLEKADPPLFRPQLGTWHN